MQTPLGPIDLAVLLASIVAAVAVGVRLGARTHSVEAYLLGDRNLPWWAILGSIVATETSTVTVLSVPGEAYGATGMKFLQLAFGYILGRTIVVRLLLPLYFQGRLFSAYEVLHHRFGGWTKTAASILFLITRNLGDGLRMFLAAMVLQMLVGWPFWASAVTIGVITLIYTYLGGMRSVVWNDCIQFVIYMAGAVATVFVIAAQLPGGWTEFWRYAMDHDKLRIIEAVPPDSTHWFRWLMTEPYTLWAGLLGGATLSIGTHGTDQMMVQRYLSARNQREAGLALFMSGVVVMLQFALFLFIGLMLACFYSHHPETQFARTDQVYAHFIVEWFPKNTGLVGLILAAVLAAVMSTLSSSLNSSASAVINDLYLPMRKTPPDPERLLVLTRRWALAFGILQVAIGVGATLLTATVVSNALTIAGYSAGLLLGIFALGVLTRRVGQTAALAGGIAGLLVLLFVQFALPGLTTGGLRMAWPWYAFIGASTTFLFGYLVSLAAPASSEALDG